MTQHDTDIGVPAKDAYLVIIDMQEVFRQPSSQWRVSGYEQAAAQVSRLVTHFQHNIVWTRFVRDPAEQGSWSDYFDRWSGCRYDAAAEAWNITEAPVDEAAVISVPTFSKWGERLKVATHNTESLVVCGVATDCCVLATVLGAVDAGKRVTVVADACAGITPEAHQQALDLMQLLAPMVTMTDTSRLVAGTTMGS